MAALAEGAAGPLRVGIYQSVGARILPALLRRFREEWPRVEVQRPRGDRRRRPAAPARARRARPDLRRPAAARRPVRVGGGAARPVRADRARAAPSSRSATRRRRSASSPACRSSRGAHIGEPETLPARPRARPQHRLPQRRQRHAHRARRRRARRRGRPAARRQPAQPRVVALPFGNRIPPRHLAIVWHRDRYRSAAADAFAALARELGDDWMRVSGYRIVQRVGGQYVATTGPMNADRGTGPQVRESHEPIRLSPITKYSPFAEPRPRASSPSRGRRTTDTAPSASCPST